MQRPVWRCEIFQLASTTVIGFYGNGAAESRFLSSLEDMCTYFEIPMNLVGDIEEIPSTVKPARVSLSHCTNDSGSPPQVKRIRSLGSSFGNHFIY